MSISLPPRSSRRRVLKVLGAGAAAAGMPRGIFAQEPTFPRGAIIRTLLKDYAPEDLAGGATLFHEHLQLGRDFNAKFSAASAAARAANGLPPAPARGGGPGNAGGAGGGANAAGGGNRGGGATAGGGGNGGGGNRGGA